MVGHCSHCTIMNHRVDVDDLDIGARIRVGEDDLATIKYIGEVSASRKLSNQKLKMLSFQNVYMCYVISLWQIPDHPGVWVGVEWDNPERGKHNGFVDNVQYFETRYACSTFPINLGRLICLLSIYDLVFQLSNIWFDDSTNKNCWIWDCSRCHWMSLFVWKHYGRSVVQRDAATIESGFVWICAGQQKSGQRQVGFNLVIQPSHHNHSQFDSRRKFTLTPHFELQAQPISHHGLIAEFKHQQRWWFVGICKSIGVGFDGIAVAYMAGGRWNRPPITETWVPGFNVSQREILSSNATPRTHFIIF